MGEVPKIGVSKWAEKKIIFFSEGPPGGAGARAAHRLAALALPAAPVCAIGGGCAGHARLVPGPEAAAARARAPGDRLSRDERGLAPQRRAQELRQPRPVSARDGAGAETSAGTGARRATRPRGRGAPARRPRRGQGCHRRLLPRGKLGAVCAPHRRGRTPASPATSHRSSAGLRSRRAPREIWQLASKRRWSSAVPIEWARVCIASCFIGSTSSAPATASMTRSH